MDGRNYESERVRDVESEQRERVKDKRVTEAE